MRTRTKFIVKSKSEFDSPKVYVVFLKETVVDEEYFVLVLTLVLQVSLSETPLLKKVSLQNEKLRDTLETKFDSFKNMQDGIIEIGCERLPVHRSVRRGFRILFDFYKNL